MLQISEVNQGSPKLHKGSVIVSEPPSPEFLQRLLLVLGYQSRQEKLLPYILGEKKEH